MIPKRIRDLVLIVALLAWTVSPPVPHGWAAVPPPQAAPARPNIVVVLSDDLGYGDLGCYGSQVIQTPHLDRFAGEGLKLTSCYAGAANCSPARTALMTGRTPYRLGVRNWIPMFSPMHVEKKEVTVATLLRQSGYATAQVGKWHLNGMFNQPGQPQPPDHGFDYWFSTQNNALPSHRNPWNFVRNGKAAGKLEGYAAQIVTDEAVRWLRDIRDREKPFFLYVCYHEPHEPIATDARFAALYPDPNDPSRPAHHGNITQMDDAFGRLMSSLDALNLRENTLVFFTSDNGPAITNIHPHGSSGPLREKKGHLYEGGIRVPGLLRWPGRIQAGTVSDVPVSGVDLLPTLAALAGFPVPDDRAIDGTDVSPLFEGRSFQRKTPLYWQFNFAASRPKVAMRVGDWKILAHLSQDDYQPSTDIRASVQQQIKASELVSFELYNLRTDIGESTDLSGKEAARLKEMVSLLRPIYQEVQKEGRTWPDWDFPRYEAQRIEWPEYYKPSR